MPLIIERKIISTQSLHNNKNNYAVGCDSLSSWRKLSWINLSHANGNYNIKLIVAQEEIPEGV